jgi:hypothetical protein
MSAGYMLGPGVGALVSRVATNTLQRDDEKTLAELSGKRAFGGTEALK